jgi:hypothetical protein
MNILSNENSESPLFILMRLTLFAIMSFMVLTVPISAEYKWMYPSSEPNTTIIQKPVDPIHFNTEDSSIQIDVGEEWKLIYTLNREKRYHVFLVGEWVMNESDPITDYDILVTGPNNYRSSHTESAGLIEQVSISEAQPYFVPEASGKYTFKIINDKRDSESDQSAYFMLIEHIDVNEWYSVDLEGRDEAQQEVLNSGWGYEFNTTSSKIKISVIVPDNGPLDMYEARLYAMANPDNEIGYSMNGVGIPLGEYFNEFNGDWGGYNTSVGGVRNILAMDSADRSGADLEFVYDAPTGESGDNVFYYLALIAEHEDDTVDFIIQTDFTDPEITIVNPPELVIEDDDTVIRVTIDDEADIEDVWIEYTTDGENYSREDLSSGVDGYEVILENYKAGDYVDYIIYAKDEFENMGFKGSSFHVKKTVTITCSITDMTLMGDQDAKITGVTTLELSPLHVNFTNGDYIKNLDIVTGEDGKFSLTYTPSALGDWSFQAYYSGDNNSLPAESNILTFQASSERTQISGILSDTIVKKSEPITISGSVEPKIPGMQVDVTFVSVSTIVSEKVPVASDGTYSFTFSPMETGIWNALVQYGDGVIYERSDSGSLEFDVIPLTIFDKITGIYLTMIRPPFIYGVVGMVGLCISSVAYVKRETIIKSLPGKLGKSIKKSSIKKKKKKGKNGDRFHRSKK